MDNGHSRTQQNEDIGPTPVGVQAERTPGRFGTTVPRVLLVVGGVLIFFTALFILFMGRFLWDSHVMLTTDAMITGAPTPERPFPFPFGGTWEDRYLLGWPAFRSIKASYLVSALLHGVIWNNYLYTLACLATSVATTLWLLKKGLLPAAAILGGIVIAWLGPNLTIIHGGHGNKPYIVLFFILGLLASEVAARRPSVIRALLPGGCIGIMLAHQPDVGLFFALFSAAHLAFSLWRAHGFRSTAWVKVLPPAIAISLMIGAAPAITGYRLFVHKVVQVAESDPAEKWDYVTQWSLPPEDMVEFFAPGYIGWNSGDPNGPYWGRTGRSKDWDKTHQGMMNLKLDDYYLGVIPLAFVMLALFAGLIGKNPYRLDVLFWSAAALTALFLAFGKFFFLYSLFYKLPLVSAIRAPVKFLQVFQVAIAILSAIGLNQLLRGATDDD